MGKSKSTYVILILLFITTFTFSFFLLGFNIGALFGISQESMQEAANMDLESAMNMFMAEGGLSQVATAYEEASTEENYDEDIEIVGEGMYHDANAFEIFRFNVATLNELFFLAIFTGLFFGADYAFNTSRNYLLLNNKRYIGMLSKTIAVAIYALFMHIYIWFIGMIATMCWSSGFDKGLTPGFFAYFFTTYLIILAFCEVVALITVLCRSRSAGITFGILFSMGTITYIVQFADMYLIYKNDNIPEDFSFSNYMLTMNLSSLMPDSSAGDYVRCIVVSVIYLALAFFLGVKLLNKRDIS